MGNYEQLKQAVSDVIKTNGNKEITGAILQSALLSDDFPMNVLLK